MSSKGPSKQQPKNKNKTNPVAKTYGPPTSTDVEEFFKAKKRPPKVTTRSWHGFNWYIQRKASPSNAESIRGGNVPGTSAQLPEGGAGAGSEAKIARLCPLPELTWANREDVWASMIKRERKHRIDVTILDKHKEITPRMRSVLIDWLIEVSEVYRLHR